MMPLACDTAYSPAALERRLRTDAWAQLVSRALLALSLGAQGGRCEKCRRRPGDRRRPARHHRACPLRGAGRWKPLLAFVEAALTLRDLPDARGPRQLAPHVLGWVLARVIALAPKACATPQEAVDRGLDRFCGVMMHEPVHPLPPQWLVAVDPERVEWRGEPKVWRGGLAVFETEHRARAPRITALARSQPAMLLALADLAKPVNRTALMSERVVLEAHRFQSGPGWRIEEVTVFAERGTSERDLVAAAEACSTLARVAQWPGPAARARAAAARVAQRHGCELPAQRRERAAPEPQNLRRLR